MIECFLFPEVKQGAKRCRRYDFFAHINSTATDQNVVDFVFRPIVANRQMIEKLQSG